MTIKYRIILERLHQCISACPDPNKRENPEGWSIKQIVGHLVDSVGNNHQRLLRYIPHGNFTFPAYDQNTFVSRAQYEKFDFQGLVTLWFLYNQLLLHIVEHIPREEQQSSTVTIGDSPPLNIEQLINDYFAHMEKHERQVLRIINA